MEAARPPTSQAESVPGDSQARLHWVDNLRTIVIVLVVNMHACVTYSHVGSWYFNAPPDPSIPQKIPFFLWQALLQSFFMGTMFFFAGYYAERSLSRRGTATFVRERLRRLGIPTLIYMLAIQPLIVIVLHPGYKAPYVGDYYRNALANARFLGNSGPMWFAFALLIFSLVFAAVWHDRSGAGMAPIRLRSAHVLCFGGIAGLATFLVRTVQPQGTSILNFQFCYFAQYVAAFVVGVFVSRRDALSAIASDPVAKKAGVAALVLGTITWVAIAVASLPVPKHGPLPLDGGWNGFALSYAFWEQLTGVGLALGLMNLCVRKLNVRTTVSAWLADRSFAVYFLHPPVLVAISLLVQPVRSNAYVMTAGVTLAALVGSFAVADVARRIPGLKAIL